MVHVLILLISKLHTNCEAHKDKSRDSQRLHYPLVKEYTLN